MLHQVVLVCPNEDPSLARLANLAKLCGKSAFAGRRLFVRPTYLCSCSHTPIPDRTLDLTVAHNIASSVRISL